MQQFSTIYDKKDIKYKKIKADGMASIIQG